MKKITFCINTTKHEKNYIELLLKSLINGIDIDLHDILIFLDSDDLDNSIAELLIAQHDLFPNLKIIRNKGLPIGYQKNINYMFQIANTDIVSYLQSDMVVGLKYDEALLSKLTKNMILCSTRVEPPLHCPFDNNITYVKNFGLTPEEFKYDDFILFSESVKDNKKMTNYFFAPFTLYKNLWNDIGGHDTSFGYSREDSDISTRFCLNKCDLKQTWNALCYHFTCTSSRGLEWWKGENRSKELIRLKNDRLEFEKFINKWGNFFHPTSYEQIEPYIGINPKIMNNIIVKNPELNFDFEIL